MKAIDRDELIATVIMLAVVLILGAAIGWSARTIHTKNKVAMAQFEKVQAEKEFYEAQTRIMQAFYSTGKGKE